MELKDNYHVHKNTSVDFLLSHLNSVPSVFKNLPPRAIHYYSYFQPSYELENRVKDIEHILKALGFIIWHHEFIIINFINVSWMNDSVFCSVNCFGW
jgi:hypothetical protein